MNKTKIQGLTQNQVQNNLKKFGYNELEEKDKITWWKILFRQINKNFVLYFLLVGVILSFFIGETLTASVILVVIAIIIIVGFIQEYKADEAIQALKDMTVHLSTVIRNGEELKIPSREIVPNDIIILRTGEKIPADCIILEQSELSTDESSLTGESVPVRKKKEDKLFMGTLVVSGNCIAKITKTGMDTEFGKIAKMISKAEKDLPLTKKVNDTVKLMGFVAVSLAVLSGLIMFFRGGIFEEKAFVDALMIIIALTVAGFPEGMPVTMITSLSAGVYRMAKKNAIVNRMSIIETLGETTIICSDKTGTITKGEMTVKEIFADGKKYFFEGGGYNTKGSILLDNKKTNVLKQLTLLSLLDASVICNDSEIKKEKKEEYSIIGSPTEAALLIAAQKAGIQKDDSKFEIVEQIPFSSERKLMSVLSKETKGKNYSVYSKGAPEVLLKKCSFIQKGNKKIRLTKKEIENILKMNKEFTSKAYRVIGVAYKTSKTKLNKKQMEEKLIFLGLVAIIDPPRPEVKEAIRICKEAGIKIKMITGDNKETAQAIAKQVGIEGRVIIGDELENLSDEELSEMIEDIGIFARVKPEHKIKIVRALKLKNETVTMTGDGVNDAPALKEAHIGVAMGINGTDVSRESADLILKDDNFATIVNAVAEGRTIFNNMRKFISYQLSCNWAELLLIFFAVLAGFPTPLLALQILLMNLVTDDMPAITLGVNPWSMDVMKRKPRRGEKILNSDVILYLGVATFVMVLGSMFLFYRNLVLTGGDEVLARTAVLAVMVCFEIFSAFNFRSFRFGVHEIPLTSNKPLIYASLLSIIVTLLVIYVPFLNNIFGTTPLKLMNWLFIVLVSFSIVVVFDILKLINRRRTIMAGLN